NEKCIGVKVLELKKRTISEIFAKVTVIATGGIGYIYQNTTNPEIATGDGIAMALRAGAKIEDMEFVQFHPTTLNKLGAPHFLISETLRGEGAILINSNGKRFMFNYDKNGELAPRDIIARVIFNELKKGTVYLDIHHKGKKFILDRFPMIYHECLKYDVDITEDLIPVSPAAHYMCGGIKTNEYGETSINNLLAFGECTCTGVHGANRLASNSLLESVVFSSLGAKVINEYINNKIESLKKPITSVVSKNIETQEIRYLKVELRKSMWDYVGIVRNEEQMALMIRKLENINARLSKLCNDGINTGYLELINMAMVAKLITTAAQIRKESRGTHYRSDYPTEDNKNWLKHICFQQNEKELNISFN
ncbi:MAG: FAD-binding protein, partial [Candidatus Bathyarchaeota archaeon]